MNENYNFFEMLGIEPEPEVKEKKETKKATKRTKATPKGQSYKLPLTFCTAYNEPFLLDATEYGKESLTINEIRKFVDDKYPVYKGISTVVVKDDRVFVGLKTDVLSEDETIKLTTNNAYIKSLWADIDLSSIMSDTTCEVSLEDVKKTFIESSPKMEMVNFVQGETCFIPILNFPVFKEDDIKFPLEIMIPGRDFLTLSEEEIKEKINSDSDEEVEKIGINEIKKHINQGYSDIPVEMMEFQYNEKDNLVFLQFNVEEASKITEKKETLYLVDGTSISLLFTRIELSPELFGGKTEVNADEIIKFLGKDYPEYNKDRTKLEFDKENNLIIPILTGSTKGSVIVKSKKEQLIDIVHKQYKDYNCYDLRLILRLEEELFPSNIYRLQEPIIVDDVYNQDDVHRCRIESTPVSLTIVSKEDMLSFKGYYTYRLTKIPLIMYYIAQSFFKEVSKKYNTEVLLQLYYNTRKNEYFYDLPKQRVTGYSIESIADSSLFKPTIYPIADFHSHNSMPAFFSHIDDADEKGNKLYGVFGKLNTDAPEFKLRAGTGGCFVNLDNIESVFRSDELIIMDQLDKEVSKLLKEAETKLLKN